jgi:hypothetical protein
LGRGGFLAQARDQDNKGDREKQVTGGERRKPERELGILLS